MASCPHRAAPRIGLSAFVRLRSVCPDCGAELAPSTDGVSAAHFLPIIASFAAGQLLMRPGTWVAALVALMALLATRALIVFLLFRYAAVSVRVPLAETHSRYRIVMALLLLLALLVILAATLP